MSINESHTWSLPVSLRPLKSALTFRIEARFDSALDPETRCFLLSMEERNLAALDAACCCMAAAAAAATAAARPLVEYWRRLAATDAAADDDDVPDLRLIVPLVADPVVVAVAVAVLVPPGVAFMRASITSTSFFTWNIPLFL